MVGPLALDGSTTTLSGEPHGTSYAVFSS
jgi:hypothetical protein